MARTLAHELEERRAASLLRELREIDGPQGTVIRLDGKEMINFSSNDYLGLATDPSICAAAKMAIDQFGMGAGASRLICGNQSPHLELEQKLAAFKGTEAALAFSSGYATAVGTIGALASREDVIILDKLAHASLIDGARLSGATIRIFPHNHLGKLESHLEWARDEFPDARVLIVTESVFSMDGDRAPLREIVEAKERFDAMLLVDEAHAVGVIGDHGRGVCEKLGVAARVEVQMGTLGKALGVSGGYICGTRALIDVLINKARSFIYSTAPPAAIAAAASAAIDFLLSEFGDERRKLLRENLRFLVEKIPPQFLARNVQSAIVPVIVGEEERALRMSRDLFESGFFVPAIRFPTVAKGSARLRITISAAHSREQIAALCAALQR